MVHSGASGLCWLPLQAPCGKICWGGQLLLPSRLTQKSSPKPTAHLYSPSSPMSPTSGESPLVTPHTCVLPFFLCRCPKTASADTLTLWAGLSCAGRTCSWAGLTDTPTQEISVHPCQLSALTQTHRGREWRKALTTDTSANGSESESQELMKTQPDNSSQTCSFREL